MPGNLAKFAVLLLPAALAALPLASRAADPAPDASFRPNFVPPKGWSEVTRPVDRPGLWRDWVHYEGAETHSIVLSVTPETRRARPYGEATVAFLKTAANVNVLSFGPATTCGDVPAYTYTYRSDRTPSHPMIIRHVLVDIGPMVGDVSYSRPPDAAERADALEALSTFCDPGALSASPAPAESAAPAG